MKRKRFYILVALTVFFLTGCGSSGATVSKNNISLQDVKTALINTPDYVTASLSQDEKELIIDAEVTIGTTESLFEITVKSDEIQVQKFIEEQVKTKYPEISESVNEEEGNREWLYKENGQLQFFCSLSESGSIYCLDVLKDINTPYLDGEHLYEYEYLTELEAPGVTASSSEAAAPLSQFLSGYSSFDFQPWNILAGDRPDDNEKSGYYSISMQPVYQGLPIALVHDSVIPWFSTTVLYSSEGIFSIHGIFLISTSETSEFEKIVSLDSVLEKFKTSFSAFALGDTVSVTRITLEYFPEINTDGSYTLSPVWSIYCNDTRTEIINDEEKKIALQYSCLYYAENGELCGVYY